MRPCNPHCNAYRDLYALKGRVNISQQQYQGTFGSLDSPQLLQLCTPDAALHSCVYLTVNIYQYCKTVSLSYVVAIPYLVNWGRPLAGISPRLVPNGDG